MSAAARMHRTASSANRGGISRGAPMVAETGSVEVVAGLATSVVCRRFVLEFQR